ncbi:MAG TPA: glycosyltransferase family 39 protein [Bacillota bacterium]|nr:glycosyltransferase family 39 protein [Bacillota bacterium]HPE38696.1 glycosyltransferase family 39 protein [Bacillota bacterium]
MNVMEKLAVRGTGGDLHTKRSETRLNQYLVFAFLFFITIAINLFCLEESPLFRYSATRDGSVYMDVGNAMKNGAVMYRDVFDHKGPLFLMLMWFMSSLPGKTITAYFVFENIAAFFSAFIAYKIAKLYLDDILSLICSCCVLLFVFGGNLREATGSLEQLLLPLLFLFMYLFLLFWENQRSRENMEDDTANYHIPRFKPCYFLIIGIICGVYLLSKMSICFLFLFVGISILVWLIVKKKYRFALQMLLYVTLGVAICFVPVLIYGFYYDCIADIWNAYVRFNQYYAATPRAKSEEISYLSIFLQPIEENRLSSPWLLVSILCGLMLKRYEKWMRYTYIFSVFSFYIFIYISKRVYYYMFLSFIPMSFLGLVWTLYLLRKPISEFMKNRAFVRLCAILIVITICIGTVCSNGNCLHSPRFLNREETGEEMLAEVVSEVIPEGEKPNVLCFLFNGTSIYSLLKTTPQLRYFYTPNINLAKNQSIFDEQKNYIIQGEPDVILSAIKLKDEWTCGQYEYIGESCRGTVKDPQDIFYVYIRATWVTGKDIELPSIQCLLSSQ